MKRLPLLAATLFAASTPALAADVGVSITVGQPGFYGHIDIGDFPRPVLVYPQPVVIHPVGVVAAPLYMHVPPGHYKHWNRYCSNYGACGRPVYFVRDSWYNNVYVPRYRERYEHQRHSNRDHIEWRGHDRERYEHQRHGNRDRIEWRGHDRDKGNHGHGNGQGRGNGKGRDG